MKTKLIFSALLFVLLSWVPVAHAQELDLSVTPAVSPTVAPIDYQLPYPGVLPGHFFYTLKTARDKLMSFLISNPVKKAEFDLLQADKRVEAAHQLVVREKGKEDVSKETLSKALNYFEEAVEKTAAAKKEGMETHDISFRLSLANKKHMEVLKSIEKELGENGKKKFASEHKRIEELGKSVSQLKP